MLTNRKTRKQIVVDAKSGRVTVSDLRQLEEYKAAVTAAKCIIYTPIPLIKLSKPIKDRAKISGIEIHYSAPRDFLI